MAVLIRRGEDTTREGILEEFWVKLKVNLFDKISPSKGGNDVQKN